MPPIILGPFCMALFATAVICASQRPSVSGRHIRMSVYNVPPSIFARKTENGSMIFEGSGIDKMNLFAHALNITYSIVFPKSEDVAKRGILQATLDQLLNGEVDGLMTGRVITPDRRNQMDFTYPSSFQQNSLLQNYPEEENQLLLLVVPFKYEVWLLLILTIAVIVPCMSILMRYFDFWNDDHQTRTMSQHLSNNALFVLAIITNQGKDLTTTRSSLRFVAGIWCLATIVLASAYTGVMTSSMAVRKLKPIIKSMEELAANNEVTVTVDSNSVLANDMLSAASGPYKILGDTLRTNPHLKIKTRAQGLDNVLNKSSVYVGSDELIKLVIDADTKMTGKCRMTVSNPMSQGLFHSTVLAKNSIFTEPFSEQHLRQWETGFAVLRVTKYQPRIEKCLVNKNVQPTTRALTLKQVSIAFFILGIGISLSCAAYIIEWIIYKGHRAITETLSD